MRRVVAFLAIFAVGFLAATFTYRGALPAYRAWRLSREKLWVWSNTASKTEVACPAAGPGVDVILALGQSLASNRSAVGEKPMAAKRDVLNFFDGKCYKAAGPLLGGDSGTGNSIWTPLGDEMIDRGAYKTVVVAVFAEGATVVKQWADDYRFRGDIESVLHGMEVAGLPPKQILWMQGEDDVYRGTTGPEYRRRFLRLATFIHRLTAAPIYVAEETLCARAPDRDLEAAQRGLVDAAKGILAGPALDTLGYRYRFDGCHMTNAGKRAAAALWVKALVGDH